MIDSSRHFLPVDTIKRTIDALMFNKMNVLHWHIIDQDSFPLQVPIVPELSEFGTIGGIYAPSDVK
jgi:hexosaminidase